MNTEAYIRAKNLLLSVSTEKGFLASQEDISNYKRIWARDGVICGLATLLDGDEKLVNTFKNTLVTLAEYQHEVGNIPSNVWFDTEFVKVSFGGLCGRVDTISWYIIGVCNYVWFTKDYNFLKSQKPHIEKGLALLQAWEFNNRHLIYTPTSGNWADEYPIEGYTLYDNCLRLWALQTYQKLNPSEKLGAKIKSVRKTIKSNFQKSENQENLIHPKALKKVKQVDYWFAAFSPKGYNIKFDAFGNALAVMLNINDHINEGLVSYTSDLQSKLKLNLLPAFWPTIDKNDKDWEALKANNTYEFRNYPFEFHNGGTWAVVNAFFGMALTSMKKELKAKDFLNRINDLNKQETWGFYENFNSETSKPIGVARCAWSAAATLLLNKIILGKKLLIG